MIVNISAEELIRIITDDYNNVRVYKRRSRINEGIKNTAKSDEKNKFFYYNNDEIENNWDRWIEYNVGENSWK